jgi:hypothetical protein
MEGQWSNFDGSILPQLPEEQKLKKPALKSQAGGGLVQKKAANLAGIGEKKKGAFSAVIDEDESAFHEGEDSEEEEKRIRNEAVANNRNVKEQIKYKTR